MSVPVRKVDKNSKASCLEEIVTHMLLNSNGVRNLKISYHPVVWPWIPNDYFSEEKVKSLHVCGCIFKSKECIQPCVNSRDRRFL